MSISIDTPVSASGRALQVVKFGPVSVSLRPLFVPAEISVRPDSGCERRNLQLSSDGTSCIIRIW